ncbi:Arrestin-C domain-containing protein [Aphelenchoides besseyi]|nr:Arrestin-C domain-containing protein [Aphelenchoides besseyi]KAI6201542.1 Arrestin-C domain-containing protein [Aphelenchoides besseyi]
MEDHTVTFKSFNILFEKEGAYQPGDELKGMIFFYLNRDVQLSPIRLYFRGIGNLYDPKNETLIESVKYWDKTVDLGTKVIDYKGGNEYSIQFKETLPLNLETSIESRSLTITYSIKARLTYGTPQNKVRPLSTIRGFTVVSPVHLDYVDPQKYLERLSFSAQNRNNYTFFLPCSTRGRISVTINLERSAYVCGENIALTGSITNNSSRRLDSVTAVMQKIVSVYSMSTSSPKLAGFSTNERTSYNQLSTEILKVKEETLCMYCDSHSTTTINRNFAAATVRPSTFEHIHVGKFAVSVGYQILIKVQQLGSEVCSLTIPIFIGTIPHSSCHNKRPYNPWLESDKRFTIDENNQERRVNYQRDKSERAVSLFESDENYLTKRSRIVQINLYPYYAYLQSSSKQTFKMLASAVKAENLFMTKLQANQLAMENNSSAEASIVCAEQPSTSVDSIQPMLPEKLLLVEPVEKAKSPLGRALSNSPSSSSRWQKLKPPAERRRSSLVPVEISITM